MKFSYSTANGNPFQFASKAETKSTSKHIWNMNETKKYTVWPNHVIEKTHDVVITFMVVWAR